MKIHHMVHRLLHVDRLPNTCGKANKYSLKSVSVVNTPINMSQQLKINDQQYYKSGMTLY